MLPTKHQRETLTEIINIALSRTAASLSELTGCRALMGATGVAVCETGDLSNELGGFVESEIASVHQSITGSVSGDAFLLLDHGDAARLSELLTKERPLTNQLNESDYEALTEFANLLLDDCVEALGNFLEAQVILSVPRLHLESLDHLLDRLAAGNEERRRALVVRVSFGLRDRLLNGRLVMALRLDSPDLLMPVERREEAQIEV